jgi:hypothetical protein
MSPNNPVSRLLRLIAKIRRARERLNRIFIDIDEVKVNQGRILATLNEQKTSTNLQDYEFKVFSQWGEDGIIQFLIKTIEIKNKTFIEFGVEDFSESNCRYLLVKDNWQGFVIDGSKDNIQKLQSNYYFWKHHLVACAAFITKDNINQLLAHSGFDEDLGILSVDIDGNDYYVLDAIERFRPRILICEFNSVFGAKRSISAAAHHSNLYAGASLSAMNHLAQKRGYVLVGTNSVGNNAFFVRRDLMNGQLRALGVEEAYAPSHFREGRDEHGALTFAVGDDRLKVIQGMPVFNVESQAIERL